MIATDVAVLVMSISSLSESHCDNSFFLFSFFLIIIIFDLIELYAYVDVRCTHYVLCTHFVSWSCLSMTNTHILEQNDKSLISCSKHSRSITSCILATQPAILFDLYSSVIMWHCYQSNPLSRNGELQILICVLSLQP